MIYNTANMLTLSRLVLVVVFFTLMNYGSFWAVPVLLLAGLTDLLDGWIARRWNQQTTFGRIADPVMDKILICSGFIFLSCHSTFRVEGSEETIKFVVPWMASVIVGREFLVTALRSASEAGGNVFHASFWGKSKMVVQFVTLAYVVLLVALWKKNDALSQTQIIAGHVLVWLTLIVTVMSGLVYLVQVERLVRKRQDA